MASMSILQNDGEPLSPCNTSRITAAPSGKNGGNVHLIASVFWLASGTVKTDGGWPGSDFWAMDSAGEVDAEIILHLPANARSDLRSLPSNVRLVDWLPMGVFP